jgi:predicted phosphoadenosine phosphosulfate sulfurtransferase
LLLLLLLRLIPSALVNAYCQKLARNVKKTLDQRYSDQFFFEKTNVQIHQEKKVKSWRRSTGLTARGVGCCAAAAAPIAAD